MAECKMPPEIENGILILEGKLWGGYKGEHNLLHPYYIITDKEDEHGEDSVFIADILKKFARKEIRITVEELD